MDVTAPVHNEEVTPVVSVIMPSYNSSQYIRQCLRQLCACGSKLQFEIIVVDSSSDGTDQIVAKEFPDIKLFHFQDQVSVGAARNIGIKKAKGQVLLFLDTDCIVDDMWIDKMYAAFKSYNADAVCGSFENGTPWSVTGSVGYYLEFYRFIPCRKKPYASQFIIGGNSGFKREVFENLRYHDQFANGSLGEDFLFSWRLSKQGKVLVCLPAITVRHLNKTGLLKVLRYQYKIGMAAYSYRSEVSPRIINILNYFPIATFLMPFGITTWIGGTVLNRQGLWRFLKFVALFPMIFSANSVWAMGFYRALTNRKKKIKESNEYN